MAGCTKRICHQAARQWCHARVECPPATARRLFSTTTPRCAEPSSSDRSHTSRAASSRGSAEDPAHLDPDYGTSDISSIAHAELQHHRELRRMLRTAAWDMPLMSEHATTYERPDKKAKPLRWRYTTYMGELHPASQKVVVEFAIQDLEGLTEAQRQTLRKIAGPRYNPDKDIIKMSCESYETQAQNRRYLLDLIKSLIAYTKDPKADSFADIPLDTRHAKPKVSLRFPAEWRLTAERKQELDAKREAKLLEEAGRIENLQIVDGQATIEAHFETQAEAVPVLVETRQRLGRR